MKIVSLMVGIFLIMGFGHAEEYKSYSFDLNKNLTLEFDLPKDYSCKVTQLGQFIYIDSPEVPEQASMFATLIKDRVPLTEQGIKDYWYKNLLEEEKAIDYESEIFNDGEAIVVGTGEVSDFGLKVKMFRLMKLLDTDADNYADIKISIQASCTKGPWGTLLASAKAYST